MEYIGVGAFINGERPRTKTALREALKTAPATVVFDATTAIGSHIGKRFPGGEIPEGVTLNVVGPDPYTARVWYGNATRHQDGTPRLT